MCIFFVLHNLFSLSVLSGKLNFSKKDIPQGETFSQKETNEYTISANVVENCVTFVSTENFYRIHKQNHHATMVNYTPK